MTITNREILSRDPTLTKIPNDGVSQVVRPQTEQQWDVLNWELRSFVCKGQYARGIEKILDSFLTNLTQAQQPAVWVSGFYGSGKSHLARVIEHLWRDVELPNGERARDLVTLTDEIRDHLTELSTAGKRLGGLWSAAGTLASGKSDAVRLAFLSILFESAGLPTRYEHARFTMWARENGYLDAIRAAIETEGRTFDKEIYDLYVSPVIAKALLEADPTLGSSVKDVQYCKAQFPPTTRDVTDDEMFDTVDDVLRLQSTTPGRLPLTLVVLDEMQQYISDDNDKALVLQNIVQGCAARFESTLLFVATGQSALTATPTLQKLIDRFPLPVELSDNDVETVVREVVLRKKPEFVPLLKSTIEASAGEIDRQLGGTRFAPRAEEKSKLVPDYPVLSNRWRLWSEMLRAVDRAGKSGLVRSQLGLIHGGVQAAAMRPLGHVIGADYLFFDDKAHVDMLMSGVLLREVDDFIQRLMSNGGDSAIKGRLCALIFLISQMSQPVLGTETGLRATSPFLADLLVEDLAEDGARLRRLVPELLDALVAEGRIVQDGDAYRLLTHEDAEWEKDYRTRLAAVRDDATRISQLRSERLMAAVDAALGNLKLIHGASKTPRKLDVYWGQDEPVVDELGVPAWIRDEWSVTESAVKKAAAEAGDESPVIFIFLPRRDSDQIRGALATHIAAEETFEQRPVPQTDEGRAARQAMGSRLDRAEDSVLELFSGVVAGARVFQGGGTELTIASSLRDAVETAANRSLIRLFPKFSQGDNANWGKVIIKAREGAPDALTAVGHHGEPTTNAVCKEVLAAVSPGGTKGADLQTHFAGQPFGWPKDAVSGAVLVLLAAGNIRASQEGKEIGGPRELQQTQIGKTTFYKEDAPPSAQQRLAVRGLLTVAGIPYEPGQEGAQLPALLQQLRDTAAAAGGAPPLPKAPDTGHLDALLALPGNHRFRQVADEHERLAAELNGWRVAGASREKREKEWRELERLLRHAEGLPVAEAIAPAIAAIQAGRQLLDEPDPAEPLLTEIVKFLRSEVSERAEQLADAQRTAVAELEAWPEWAKLSQGDRDAIVVEAKLVPTVPPDVATESKLLESLDAIPLSAWADRISLVGSRHDQARQRASKKLDPQSVEVKPPSATFKPGDDPIPYFDQLRAVVQSHLDAGTTVII